MSKAKAKGTRAETNVVKFLQTYGIDAKRQPLHGNKDQGDVVCDGAFALEVKAGEQTAGYSRSLKAKWLAQAEAEGINAQLPCYLVICVYNHRIGDAEVWDGPNSFQYLDEFAESWKDMGNGGAE